MSTEPTPRIIQDLENLSNNLGGNLQYGGY